MGILSDILIYTIKMEKMDHTDHCPKMSPIPVYASIPDRTYQHTSRFSKRDNLQTYI